MAVNEETIENNELTLQEIGEATMQKFKENTRDALKAIGVLEHGVKAQEQEHSQGEK